MADDEERGEAPDVETPPELSERRFAENLRTAREEKGVSQVKLAQEMALRGWPWRQQTVTRVEGGQRMVRLGEALAVAEILGTNLVHLTASTRETTAVTLLAANIDGQARFRADRSMDPDTAVRPASAEDSCRRGQAGRLPRFLASPGRGREGCRATRVTPEQAVAEGRTEDQDMRSSIAEFNERARMVTNVVRADVDEGGTIRTIAQLHPLSERQVRDILKEKGGDPPAP